MAIKKFFLFKMEENTYNNYKKFICEYSKLKSKNKFSKQYFDNRNNNLNKTNITLSMNKMDNNEFFIDTEIKARTFDEEIKNLFVFNHYNEISEKCNSFQELLNENSKLSKTLQSMFDDLNIIDKDIIQITETTIYQEEYSFDLYNLNFVFQNYISKNKNLYYLKVPTKNPSYDYSMVCKMFKMRNLSINDFSQSYKPIIELLK